MKPPSTTAAKPSKPKPPPPQMAPETAIVYSKPTIQRRLGPLSYKERMSQNPF